MELESHSSLSCDLKATANPSEVQVTYKSFPSGETLTKGIGKSVENIDEVHRSQNVLSLYT